MTNEPTKPVRSMPVAEWPDADRIRWEAVCQPGARLRRGGAAAHLKTISRDDLARRYGYFLDHLHRAGRPLSGGTAADQVTPANVAFYLEELKGRVGSVTVYGSISKLRRMAELLNPELDLAWLRDIEADLDIVKQPKSKMAKLVDTSVLVEVGLTLLHEAELEPEVSPYRSVTLQSREALRRARGAADRAALNRAVLARDGLIVALLALCPVRLKNLAGLELGAVADQDRRLLVDRSRWRSDEVGTARRAACPGVPVTTPRPLRRLPPRSPRAGTS